jgi:hypothetical protein
MQFSQILNRVYTVITSQDIRPGRILQWVYAPSAEQWSKNNLNLGGKERSNHLYGHVSVVARKVGQACSMAMYEKDAINRNPGYIPSDREPQREATAHPCIFLHLTSLEEQVMIMNSRTVEREYFVDGRPATAEELAVIAQYRKPRKPRDPSKSKVEFVNLANLKNVDGPVPADIEED